MEFVGHLAFVTGGANGIGAQVCRDLAQAGASVVIADRQSEGALDLAASLPTGDGRKHFGVPLDVSKKAEVEFALVEVLRKYGRPADLIINCAGIAHSYTPLEEMKEEHLDETMSVNFKGTFLVTQAFGKALLDAKNPGSIVNVSSLLAYSARPGQADYCASKAAVMQFTKVAAKEWGPKGIRVNSIHPGRIRTAMTISQENTPSWEAYKKEASLRRIGEPKGDWCYIGFSIDCWNKIVAVLGGFWNAAATEIAMVGNLPLTRVEMEA